MQRLGTERDWYLRIYSYAKMHRISELREFISKNHLSVDFRFQNQTAVRTLAQEGNQSAVELLVNYFNANINEALIGAAQEGHHKLVIELLKKGGQLKFAILGYARGGRTKQVLKLLEHFRFMEYQENPETTKTALVKMIEDGVFADTGNDTQQSEEIVGTTNFSLADIKTNAPEFLEAVNDLIDHAARGFGFAKKIKLACELVDKYHASPLAVARGLAENNVALNEIETVIKPYIPSNPEAKKEFLFKLYSEIIKGYCACGNIANIAGAIEKLKDDSDDNLHFAILFYAMHGHGLLVAPNSLTENMTEVIQALAVSGMPPERIIAHVFSLSSGLLNIFDHSTSLALGYATGNHISLLEEQYQRCTEGLIYQKVCAQLIEPLSNTMNTLRLISFITSDHLRTQLVLYGNLQLYQPYFPGIETVAQTIHACMKTYHLGYEQAFAWAWDKRLKPWLELRTSSQHLPASLPADAFDLCTSYVANISQTEAAALRSNYPGISFFSRVCQMTQLAIAAASATIIKDTTTPRS